MEETYRAVVRRRTHTLVYGAAEGQDEAGARALDRILTVMGEDPATGARWETFRAEVRDVDPKGRPVIRLPGQVEREALEGAWPGHPHVSAMKPWPHREVAVRFLSGKFPYRDHDQARVVDYLKAPEGLEGGVRMVVAGTAVGKSYCSIRAWAEEYGDVLLGTFAALPHLDNFRTELLKFTSLTEDDILVVSDGRETLRRAIKKELKPKVVLVLHRTVWRCMDETIKDNVVAGGSNEFFEFCQAMGVGTHVSDECHLELKSVVTLGLMTNFRRTVYLTATPERTNWMENRVLQQQLPLRTAFRLKKVSRLKVRQLAFDSFPSDFDVSRSAGFHSQFDPNYYFDYLSKQANYGRFVAMLKDLVERAFEEGGSGVAIVLAGKLGFLDRVVQSMTEEFRGTRTVGNFSSRVPLAKRIEELQKDIIVTTEKSFNGSVNPVRTSHMLLTAPISSSIWVEQICGRLRGLNGTDCVVLDLWDKGFPKLKDLAAKRRTTFRKISTELLQENYDF